MWRKCFYDVILLMRKNLKYIRPNSGLEASVRSHLVAANGIYHGLLLKVQTELRVRRVGGKHSEAALLPLKKQKKTMICSSRVEMFSLLKRICLLSGSILRGSTVCCYIVFLRGPFYSSRSNFRLIYMLPRMHRHSMFRQFE